MRYRTHLTSTTRSVHKRLSFQTIQNSTRLSGTQVRRKNSLTTPSKRYTFANVSGILQESPKRLLLQTLKLQSERNWRKEYLKAFAPMWQHIRQRRKRQERSVTALQKVSSPPTPIFFPLKRESLGTTLLHDRSAQPPGRTSRERSTR